ncbi:MAG TPA: DNA-binding protein [Bacteroidales bacterium]|nr:DNA-binding protein [Bacteroidales bacterium]
MAIKYKVIERGEPGVAGGGEKKFYATNVLSGEKTLAGLTQDIEKISTVSGADIRAVLYALVDVMTGALADGQNVRLGELGSFRISISSEGKPKAEDVNAYAIRGAKVIFTPGKAIKDTLATLKFEKA